jgi:hypothetical protein
MKGRTQHLNSSTKPGILAQQVLPFYTVTCGTFISEFTPSPPTSRPSGCRCKQKARSLFYRNNFSLEFVHSSLINTNCSPSEKTVGMECASSELRVTGPIWLRLCHAGLYSVVSFNELY